MQVREAFRESLREFIHAVEQVPVGAWDGPGLGVWTVRELVAHVVRVVERTAAYSGQGGPVDVESGAAYYERALSTPRVHEDIASRARESVALLGADPVETAMVTAERTLTTIDALDDDAPFRTPFGTLRLVDYLPTRTLELVVHTMDLAQATNMDLTPGHAGLAVTLKLLGEIALERGDGTAVVRALSGRQALDGRYSALA